MEGHRAVAETNPSEGLAQQVGQVLDRLVHIEAALAVLVQQHTIKEWYSTTEAAELLGKDPFTVREWCRLRRVRAEKCHSGRGKYQAWVISHAEIQRIQREGLLPFRPQGVA